MKTNKEDCTTLDTYKKGNKVVIEAGDLVITLDEDEVIAFAHQLLSSILLIKEKEYMKDTHNNKEMSEEWKDCLYKLVDEDYDIEDLVGVCKIARRNGFVSGRNSLKGLLRECYNTIVNSTGLDDRKVVTESSLARRVREAVNE